MVLDCFDIIKCFCNFTFSIFVTLFYQEIVIQPDLLKECFESSVNFRFPILPSFPTSLVHIICTQYFFQTSTNQKFSPYLLNKYFDKISFKSSSLRKPRGWTSYNFLAIGQGVGHRTNSWPLAKVLDIVLKTKGLAIWTS